MAYPHQADIVQVKRGLYAAGVILPDHRAQSSRIAQCRKGNRYLRPGICWNGEVIVFCPIVDVQLHGLAASAAAVYPEADG